MYVSFLIHLNGGFLVRLSIGYYLRVRSMLGHIYFFVQAGHNYGHKNIRVFEP